MNYFVDCETLEELKQLYKKLVMKNHPDKGGDVAVMQEINAQYEKMLERLAMQFNAQNEDSDKVYDWKNDMFAEIIQKIINFENMNIEIIGTWIWCTNSFEYHEQLKNLGFWYSANKKAWVYSGTKKKFFRSKNKLDDLRNMWGSEKVETVKQSKLA